MKRLSDKDIENMISTEFTPDIQSARRSVHNKLKLSHRIPPQPEPTPPHKKLDLHQCTEEQAWSAIMDLATSGIRSATIITGASGILKIKFQQWARDSLLSPYIISYTPLNNGSFAVKFKKQPLKSQS